MALVWLLITICSTVLLTQRFPTHILFFVCKVMDEWLPGSAYASVFEESCVNQLAASINSSSADYNSTFYTLRSVYEKACPNQCSGHGMCVQAKCVCDEGNCSQHNDLFRSSLV